MSNPQQPEVHRSGRGGATHDSREPETVTRDPQEEGGAGPTPAANATEDERRSGKASKTRDAFER